MFNVCLSKFCFLNFCNERFFYSFQVSVTVTWEQVDLKIKKNTFYFQFINLGYLFTVKIVLNKNPIFISDPRTDLVPHNNDGPICANDVDNARPNRAREVQQINHYYYHGFHIPENKTEFCSVLYFLQYVINYFSQIKSK